MKRVRLDFNFIAFIGVFLLFGNVAAAQEFTDYLNLASKQAGSTFGQNLIVGMDEDTQAKWISGYTGDGSMTVKPIALSDEFEIVVKAVPKSSTTTYIFLVSGEDKIELRFSYVGAYLNKASGGDSWRINDVNVMRLHVNGTLAQLYVNDVFYQKVTLDKAYLTYTSMVLTELPTTTYIYEMKGRNLKPVKDCSGAVGGTAYVDDCGNCVGGTTDENPCSIISESDFLNLSAYSEGDTLDTNLIVGINEDTNQKWISGYTGDGSLTVKPVDLSDEFEIVIKAVPKSSTTTYIFLISGEDKIELRFSYVGVYLNKASGGDSWRINDVNVMRLYVNGTVAKLYVNDVFYQKVTLTKPNLTYTQITVNDLAKTQYLYELKGRNLERTANPPVKDCTGVVGGTAYIDTCGICVGGTTGKTPCTTQVIWDADNDKRWSLPDIIYGLQVLTGFRK